MNKKILTAVSIALCIINSVFAQKESNVWYFGGNAGLDFNSGSPVVLSNGMINTLEGCSSIADANGNLLFYTDGITVWDRNHIEMPNGYSLQGGWSSSQSALIIPFPGNSLMYYIFTVSEMEASSSDFRYSVVDMSLNGGNGDVSVKNILIISPVTEKLTAVRNSNNNEVWVMVHGEGTDLFMAYLITSLGISSSPVISSVGLNLSNYNTRGCMKFSPDGSKIAFAAIQSNLVELFDFNITTGIVSNEILLSCPPIGYSYGLEFSPSGNYLYCSLTSQKQIFQWDITSNSSATINASQQLIGTSTSVQPPDICSLQSGPDGKIYVALLNSGYLGVINYPDSSGTLSNYADTSIFLGGNNSKAGLPNFLTSYFLPTGHHELQSLQKQLSISPNPVSDKINISLPTISSEIVSVKIYSAIGEIVFEEKINPPMTNYQISISNFKSGIYFLKIHLEKDIISVKVLVTH